MEPYLVDPDFTLYNGDVLDVLRSLPAESVDCCITSPPYWGLRDYGTAEWEGGDPDCEHVGSIVRTAPPGTEKQASNTGANHVYSGDCACGAKRIDSQLGLEPTPELYVAHMVEVFREVKRVLAKHGTCWLNIGDSYAGSWGNQGRKNERGTQREINGPMLQRLHAPDCDMDEDCTCVYPDRGSHTGSWVNDHDTLKAKDLVGIPWRLAFALQADGWYLRSDIIWSKPNPMPESVTDRPTKAHEYIFLLTKSPRYYFDQEAVREPAKMTLPPPEPTEAIDPALAPESKGITWGGRNVGADGSYERRQEKYAEIKGANIRSVWEIGTQPFAEAHFATFPEDLPRRCLLAGCAEGGIVLDPFMGSGTTALVARKQGRRAVGIELNPEYCALIARRLSQQSLFV